MSQDVVGAVNALFGENPVTQQAAVQWLNSFTDSKESANLILGALNHDSDAHVQFFVANMLLTSLKRHWSQLSASEQASLKERLRQEVDASLTDSRALSWIALQRLIFAHAFSSVYTGPAAMTHILNDAFALASKGGLQVALSLTGSVAEFCMALHRTQLTKAVATANSFTGKSLALVLFALDGHSGQLEIQQAALECLSNWMKLDEGAGAGCLLSPAQFLQQQGKLLSLALGKAFDVHHSVSEPAASFITLLFSSYMDSGDAEAERLAVQSVAQSLLQLHGGRSLPVEVNYNLARMACSLADRDAAAIAGNTQQAVALAQLMADMLSVGHPGTVECAVDFFESLNQVPVASRHPLLGLDLNNNLLLRLVHAARYPEGFRSWDDQGDSTSESFADFREHVVVPGLETCRDVLASAYLTMLTTLLQQGSTWQDMEAVLFALRLAGASPRVEDQSKVLSIREVLSERVVTQTGNEFMLATLIDCVAAFSTTLVNAAEDKCEIGVQIFMAGLSSQSAAKAASDGLAAFCGACTRNLADSLLQALPAHLTQHLLGSNLELDDKETLLSALCHLMETAEMNSLQANQVTTCVLEPLLARARATMNLSGDNSAEFAELLLLIAEFIRQIESGMTNAINPGQCKAVLNFVWPMLGSFVEFATTSTAKAAQALCKVISEGLKVPGVQVAGHSFLEEAVQMVRRLFPADSQACMEVLHTALEWHKTEAGSQQLLGHMMSDLSNLLKQILQSASLEIDLASAVYTLLAEVLEEADHAQSPSVIDCYATMQQDLPVFLGSATESLSRTEPDSLKSAIRLLTASLVNGQALVRSTVQSWMSLQGHSLVRAILRATCATAPGQCFRPLAKLLHNLLNGSFGPSARSAVQATLSQDELIGKCLSAEVRRKLCDLLLRMEPRMLGQFGCLISDMAGIARHEASQDVLLAYEI